MRGSCPLTGTAEFLGGPGKLPGQDHVPAGLGRLSVVCEHLEDLWTDLEAALDIGEAARSGTKGNGTTDGSER